MTILTDDDFELFTRFKIRAMGDKLREIIDDESYDHVGFEEKIKLMLDAETEARGARKIARLIRQARFKYKDACVEDIEYPPERKLSRDRIERLASCQWVRDRETLIIIPRHGKREKPRSARPSATPHAAGESPHDTRACRTCPGEIDRARLDGQAAYYRKVDEFKSIDLLILDDFLTTPVNAADSILISREHGGTQLGRRHAHRQPMRTRAMVREVRQRAHRRQYPESSHRLRPVSRTRRPRHAPTQHHTQRRKRMEGSDRRHQRITLSTKHTAGTIHRLPAVPLIGDPITKNDYFPLSDKLKRVYEDIDQWRNRPLAAHSYPYLFVDGVWHKRTWGGSVENVSVLVAIGVDDTGRREVVGVAEGMKEDKASWEQFVRSMIERGLRGVRLVVGDRCAGLVSTVNSMLPDARYQRCMVHFMRNVLSKVSHKHAAWAASALKAVFAMESRQAALEKAEQVATEMESKGLKAAASCLREGISETTTYLLDDYPVEHRRRIRTNNMIERPDREIRRRTRVVGSFPDGRSALMLVCARIRYVTANQWSARRYLDMSRLDGIMQSTD